MKQHQNFTCSHRRLLISCVKCLESCAGRGREGPGKTKKGAKEKNERELRDPDRMKSPGERKANDDT